MMSDKQKSEPIEDRITKVVLRELGAVEIQLQTQASSGGIEVNTLRSPDEPVAELRNAMQSLAAHAVRLLELPVHYIKDVRVTAVAISYSKGLAFVTITAEKTIAGLRIFKFKTPPSSFSGDTQTAIDRVCAAAMAYLRGDRQQTRLFEANAEGYRLVLHRSGVPPIDVAETGYPRGESLYAVGGRS
jgi:hypothetical protein